QVYTTYNSSDSAYVFNSGTSFSSPIVAGAFALVLARYPGDTYRQAIQRVLGAVDPLPSLVGKCVSGGRLNLARALGSGVAADFVSSPTTGLAPLTVHFTNSSVGTLTGSLWNFG